MLSEIWVRRFGVLGTLLLFLALLFFLYDNALSNRVFALVVGGLLGLGLWVSLAPNDFRGWLSGRQAATGTTSFILTIGFTAFVIVAYDLVDQQNITLDYTCNEKFTINQSSLDTLARLQAAGGRIRLAGFYPRSTLRERESADVILRQFDQNPNVELQYIDPDESPLLARQYGYIEYISVQSDGRRDAVFLSLVLPDGSTDIGSVKPIYPINEREISTAILELISVSTTKFYFTTGHGEFDINSQAGTGLSRAANGLRQGLNIETGTLNLLTDDIPEDATAIIIAGHSTPFVQSEVDKLAAFTQAGGRLLILANPPYVDAAFGGLSVPLLPDSPFAQWLWSEFGFRPRPDLIVDKGSSFDTEFSPVPILYGNHPIMANFQNTALVFLLARSVELVETPVGTQQNYLLDPLFYSSQDSYSESSLQVLPSGSLSEFDPQSDLLGPLVMGVAVREAGEINLDPGARIVFIGDVDWITNDLIVNFPGNAALLTQIAQWISGTPELVTPDAVISCDLLPIYASSQDRQRVSALTSLVLPLLVFAVGGLMLYVRQRA